MNAWCSSPARSRAWLPIRSRRHSMASAALAPPVGRFAASATDARGHRSRQLAIGGLGFGGPSGRPGSGASATRWPRWRGRRPASEGGAVRPPSGVPPAHRVSRSTRWARVLAAMARLVQVGRRGWPVLSLTQRIRQFGLLADDVVQVLIVIGGPPRRTSRTSRSPTACHCHFFPACDSGRRPTGRRRRGSATR